MIQSQYQFYSFLENSEFNVQGIGFRGQNSFFLLSEFVIVLVDSNCCSYFVKGQLTKGP